jgi:hypothetical protein
MSNRYKGGVISATPPTTTGGNDGVASGAWTLEQQMQLQAAGLWPNQPIFYIEDVFSTYLWTGTGATLSIVNDIDLATKGGLTWIKDRDVAYDNFLCDTERGALNELRSNTTQQQNSRSNSVTAFNSNGFSLGSYSTVNSSAEKYVAWTLRKQPKFFDIQTWSGSGSNRTISHNLGSVPACIMVKAYSGTTANSQSWAVYHRSLANTEYLVLNSTDAKATGATRWNSTTPTSTVFTVGTDSTVNASGNTYIAYIFAHDSGGFGLNGTDNVISCGSFTAAGGGATVNLGYEPQWVLYKRTDATDDWKLTDSMRGMYAQTTADAPILYPNLSSAEATPDGLAPFASATGFYFNGIQNFPGSDTGTYIYIAIRRGPMAVPTDGTSVFEPATRTGTGANATVTTSISPVDMAWAFNRNGTLGQSTTDFDRLRGALNVLYTGSTASEFSAANTLTGFDVQNGYRLGSDSSGYGINYSGATFVNYNFRRAPGFFDEVCYTGTGSAQTLTHNLGAVPELIITKNRTASNVWYTYTQTTGATKYLRLNTVDAETTGANVWNNTAPTSTQFTVGSSLSFSSGDGFVAYLFATCAGVSKVGTYTGTGTLTTINCGFTGGARFVLIKKSSGVGSWFVWDTARGMISGTDPSLRLNVTDAEVNGDSIYSVATGFQLLASPFENVNINGDVYIFLAIA